MMLLFQFSVIVLGFVLGSWLFGLTELFIEDSAVRRKVQINAILITFIIAVFSFLNL